MAVVDFVYNNLLWIGIILLIPVFSRLSKIIIFEIMLKLRPNHKIIIRHFHNGHLKITFEIDLKSDEPYVRQLNRNKKAKQQ